MNALNNGSTGWGIDENDEAIVTLFTDVEWSGSGNVNDPFTISKASDLQLFLNKMTKGETFENQYVKLMNDIDLKGVNIKAFAKPYDANFGGFKGTFDGNNKTISNMTVNQGTVNNVGLIRKLGQGGKLMNLNMYNPNLTGANFVGALVANVNDGTITGCVVERPKVIAQGGQNCGILFGSVVRNDEHLIDQSIALTKNYYFDAQCESKAVGNGTESEDVEDAEEALRLDKGKNIETLTPQSVSLTIRKDASILAPTRLQDFIVRVVPSIRQTASRDVVFSVTGGTIENIGENFFRVTPDAENDRKLHVNSNYSSIWAADGTSGKPFEIASAEDFLAIGTKVNTDNETYSGTYFKLVKDIDMTDVEGFTPIGYGEGKHFDGVFDGNNHTIIGLHYADSESEQGIGLFGNLNGEVKNLNLLRPNFEGKNKVGAIAGNANTAASKITGNFVVDATIKGQDEEHTQFGLLTGASTASYTNNCYRRLDGDLTVVMGSSPEANANEMFILTSADKVTLTNIVQTGKRVVADSTYCLPNVPVTLNIKYEDAETDIQFLDRFHDGYGNVLTLKEDSTWQFTLTPDEQEEGEEFVSTLTNTVVITPDRSNRSGYYGQGENEKKITYIYDALNKTLTFEGTGIMRSLNNNADMQPWKTWRNDIETIVVGEGITNLGAYCFSFTGAKNVILPSTLKEIGKCVFHSMTKLKDITLPDSINKIGQYAFAKCANLKNIVIPRCYAAPTIGSYLLTGASTSCKIHVPKTMLNSFIAANSSYTNYYKAFSYPVDVVTVTATMNDSIRISSEGVTPAKVNVTAVIKQPFTVVFDDTDNLSCTYNEFTEKNPFVVLQAEGVSTKPANGKTSVIVDNGNYALDFYAIDEYDHYNTYYEDDLGIVYSNSYKVTITPQEGKPTPIGETTGKDACNDFFVDKATKGMTAFTIDDKDRVSYTASAEPVAARDTLYFPEHTQFELTYTPKKATYNEEYNYWEQADQPIGDDQFVAFRANAAKGWGYDGRTPWYGLSSAEMVYIDATHSSLTLLDEAANVLADVMNKSDEECDIIPEKGEIFFHTKEPGGYSTPQYSDFHYFPNHYEGFTTWDKVAHIVKTIYFDEQIESIPSGCFRYMDRLEDVYFFSKNMPTFHGTSSNPNSTGIAIGNEKFIYLPEDGLQEWKDNYNFYVYGQHGELLPIPATSIEGMEVSLTVEGEPCTIYKAANDETGEPEVLGGTYETTYDGNYVSDRVIPVVLDGGFELDDTEHYSLRAFRVGDDEDRDGTDIHNLKNAGTYRLKIVGTRFHKGTIDLCNLVIKQAPFESITYGTLPDKHMYAGDRYIDFQYGWMDDDWNYYESPFYFNGEPLDVYHYGSLYWETYGYNVKFGDDDFELDYSDNDHVGSAALTLRSRNRNFTEGEHTLYFNIYGEDYEGTWGDLAWDITQGVLTIKPKEGLTEAAMIEAEPDEGNYNYKYRGYPWFWEYVDDGYGGYDQIQHFNSITSINICEGVTSIADEAFSSGEYHDDYGEDRYKNLKTINVPASVQSIGDHAFDSKYVKNIVFAHTTGVPPLTNSNAFPTRDDGLIWVNNDLYNSAIVAENWVEHKDQIVPPYVDITVGTAGMRTYGLQYPLDFTQQEAQDGQTSPLKAYVAISKYDSDASELTFTSITHAPGFTGLLLKGDEGTYRVPTRFTEDDVKNNLLRAVTKDTWVKAEPKSYDSDNDEDVDCVNFILANGTNGIGFYPLSGEGGTITANKAYLRLHKDWLPDNINGSRGIKLVFNDNDQTQDIESPETGIREIATDMWYDLSGHRLSAKPTRSGLYIHNGKKVVIK